MTHSLAWDALKIRSKNEGQNCFLVRRFELMAGDLPEELHKGIVALPLRQGHRLEDYVAMDPDEIVQNAITRTVEVRMKDAKSVEQVRPYAPEIVARFWELLNE